MPQKYSKVYPVFFFQRMQLKSRKQAIVKLIENMQQYQFDQIDPEQPLDPSIRALTEDDIST